MTPREILALLREKEVRAEVTQSIKGTFDRLNREQVRRWREAQEGEDGKKGPPPVAEKVTTKLVANVMQALTGLARLRSSVDAPCWCRTRPSWRCSGPTTPDRPPNASVRRSPCAGRRRSSPRRRATST